MRRETGDGKWETGKQAVRQDSGGRVTGDRETGTQGHIETVIQGHRDTHRETGGRRRGEGAIRWRV